MDPCIPFEKFGPTWQFIDLYFKIRNNLTVHGSLYLFLKIRTKMAVHGSLFQNLDQFGGPWIPITKFGPIWRFMDPCIPFKKFGPKWRSMDPCIPFWRFGPVCPCPCFRPRPVSPRPWTSPPAEPWFVGPRSTFEIFFPFISSSDQFQIRVWTESVRKLFFFLEKVQTQFRRKSVIWWVQTRVWTRIEQVQMIFETKSVLVQTVVTSGDNITLMGPKHLNCVFYGNGAGR